MPLTLTLALGTTNCCGIRRAASPLPLKCEERTRAHIFPFTSPLENSGSSHPDSEANAREGERTRERAQNLQMLVPYRIADFYDVEARSRQWCVQYAVPRVTKLAIVHPSFALFTASVLQHSARVRAPSRSRDPFLSFLRHTHPSIAPAVFISRPVSAFQDSPYQRFPILGTVARTWGGAYRDCRSRRILGGIRRREVASNKPLVSNLNFNVQHSPRNIAHGRQTE